MDDYCRVLASRDRVRASVFFFRASTYLYRSVVPTGVMVDYGTYLQVFTHVT